jgi:Nicotinic acid phosphoribosyltransferase
LAEETEFRVKGVRIDSGDIAKISQQVRSLLPNVTIYASGDIDEWQIQKLQQAGACLDGYGIGTKLVTGQPVNGVYKLVEINGIPVSKKSADKQTYAYAKQIWRSYEDGLIQEDVVTRADDTARSAQPLLELVIKSGELLKPPDDLEVIALRVRDNVRSLPPSCRDISQPTPPPVTIDPQLIL